MIKNCHVINLPKLLLVFDPNKNAAAAKYKKGNIQ